MLILKHHTTDLFFAQNGTLEDEKVSAQKL